MNERYLYENMKRTIDYFRPFMSEQALALNTQHLEMYQREYIQALIRE